MAFAMSFPVDFREVFERPLPELEREWDYAHLRRRNPKILRKLRQEYDANEWTNLEFVGWLTLKVMLSSLTFFVVR